GGPGIANLLEKAHNRVATHKRPRLRPPRRRTHHDIGVHQLLTIGVHIAPVPHAEAASHDLHVLLRHRPPSIPPPSPANKHFAPWSTRAGDSGRPSASSRSHFGAGVPIPPLRVPVPT